MLAHPTAFSELLELPTDSIVRVVLGGREEGTHTNEEALDPKNFGNFAEYRTALILRRQRQTRSTKSIIEKKARALGLRASSARTLNAVTVEGSAERVLTLIEQVQPRTVVLERRIMLPTSPQPR